MLIRGRIINVARWLSVTLGAAALFGAHACSTEGKPENLGPGCFIMNGQSACALTKNPVPTDPKFFSGAKVSQPPGVLPKAASLDTTGLVVQDQGATAQTCSGFATRYAMGIKAIAQKGQWVDFSPPHIFHIAGQGSEVCSSGSSVWITFGGQKDANPPQYVVDWPTWAYDPSSCEGAFASIPQGSTLDAKGQAYIKESLQIGYNSVDDLKAAIAQGWPPVITVQFDLYSGSGWYGSGDIDVPPPIYVSDGGPYYHDIALVSYDDAAGKFKFVNSWGKGFGTDGFGSLTYKYIEKSSLGGLALTVLAFKNDACPSDLCSANNLTPGDHCKGDQTGSSVVTCGVVNGCTQVVGETPCAGACAQDQCSIISCGDGMCVSPETCADCQQDCGACASCSDGIQNQGETGIDCGGPCAPCGPPSCNPPSCDDNNACTSDQCSNGACQHAPVADGTACGGGMQCKSGQCVKPPSCPAGAPGPAMVTIPNPNSGTTCIDSTEVTRDQYAMFVAATNNGQSTGIEGLGPVCSWNTSYVPTTDWPPGAKGAHPVVGVDWCDAYAYCKWAGKRLCGSLAGGPTPSNQFDVASVSQWQNACSAGGAHMYPYGDVYSGTACNGSDKGVWTMLPVASLATCQGGFPGVFDMSGNAGEWEDSCDAATGPTDTCWHRGGAYYYGQPVLTCAAGNNASRQDALGYIGFRCCGP